AHVVVPRQQRDPLGLAVLLQRDVDVDELPGRRNPFRVTVFGEVVLQQRAQGAQGDAPGTADTNEEELLQHLVSNDHIGAWKSAGASGSGWRWTRIRSPAARTRFGMSAVTSSMSRRDFSGTVKSVTNRWSRPRISSPWSSVAVLGRVSTQVWFRSKLT